MFEHCKFLVVLAFRQYLFDPIELFLIDLDLVETLLVMQAVPPFGRSWCFAFLNLGVYQALSVLHSQYQSERHLEEVVIVNRLIAREKLKTKAEPDTGFHDDM